MKRWLRRKFIDWLIHDLFKAVDRRDILRVDGPSEAYFNDKRIPAETLERLIQDAQRFESSMLWQIISRQLNYRASELIAQQSKTTDDIYFGKALLWWVKVVEEIFEELRKS